MSEHSNTQLPDWPFEGFTTDSSRERVERVIAVERQLVATFGGHTVPDKQGNERYFAQAIDALMQRRWLARYIVDSQDWRENFLRITAQHGAVLPTMRQVAEAQKAEWLATGRVTTTGFEALDAFAQRTA